MLGEPTQNSCEAMFHRIKIQKHNSLGLGIILPRPTSHFLKVYDNQPPD